MFDKTALVSKLGDYSRDSSKKTEILTNIMYNPDLENRIEMIPGVNDEIPIPNALIGDPSKPIKDAGDITYKTNVISLDAEKIKARECMLAVKVVPTKLWNTYLATLHQENQRRKAESKSKGIPYDPFVMPFHDFILGKLIESAQSNLYNKALFRGVRDEDGTDSATLFDGFMKHIATATGTAQLVETITGAITVDNVLAKLYLVNDALGEESKNNALNAHLPSHIFDMLARTFTPTINQNIIASTDPFEKVRPRVNSLHIPGTNATAFREPGMGQTNQVIFTEPGNLNFGYSMQPSDIDFMVQEEDFTLKLLMYFKAGTAIGKIKKEFGALAVNEAIPSSSE